MIAPLITTETRLEGDFEAKWSRWRTDYARQDAALQRLAITTAAWAGCGLLALLTAAIYLR
jgi:hypothetical protein